MGFLDNFRKITNDNVTLENIDKVNDDETLAHIALNNRDFYIKHEALSRIKDDSVLASLVHSNGPNTLTSIGGQALMHISDENIIADLWCNSEVEFSYESLDKISNPDLLVRIAKEAPNSKNRLKASERAPASDEILYDIYKSTGNRSVIYEINDEDIIKDIYSSAKDMDDCRAAVKNIHDESFLMEVFKTFNRNSVTDRCLNCKGDRVRIAAVENISDKSFLEDVANNYDDKYVREAARKRLDQLE